MAINKSTIARIFIVILFILSFIHPVTLLLFLFSLLFLFVQKEVGAIKILVLLTLRTFINPGLAISIFEFQSIKWAILLLCAAYLWLAIFKLSKSELDKIKWILFFVGVFTLYHIASGFAFSSLPVVAASKVMSYSIVFLGVLIGVAYINDKFNLIDWLIKCFYLIFISSTLLLVHPIGYFRNGTGFQGITSQPNLFGVLSVLFITLLLTRALINRQSSKLHVFISVPLIFGMLIMSDSRTSLIAALVILGTYLLILNRGRMTAVKLAALCFGTAIMVVTIPLIQPYLISYFYKGQEPGDLLLSRESQLSTLLFNFSSNPLFGTGFAVPLLPFRSYTFSDNFVVEPGNIILALLAYGGIFGILLFTTYMLCIFFSNRKNLPYNILLIMAPILVNMGEMSFFSSNGSGILSYLFLSIYVFIDKTNTIEE